MPITYFVRQSQFFKGFPPIHETLLMDSNGKIIRFYNLHHTRVNTGVIMKQQFKTNTGQYENEIHVC